ncbi:MAG: hypothetical protein MUF56_09580 [Solirubrobacteraceae bacterium]|nr:hypothetical protein [Solirubrobacteraceae bacterium]
MAVPTADQAAHTVQELLANPYVQRATHDPAVRDNARVAYTAARQAIERAKGSDNVLNAIFDDEKLQAELRTVGQSVANARRGLIEPPRKKKRRWGRLILLAGVGAVLAIALSEGLRNKVLDVLFGARRSSTTSRRPRRRRPPSRSPHRPPTARPPRPQRPPPSPRPRRPTRPTRRRRRTPEAPA